MARDKFTAAYTYWANVYCVECGEKLPLDGEWVEIYVNENNQTTNIGDN